ncbi:hypothetical protein GXP67_12080 [Rhodocytophaga rosea]|uniref:Uncharacterized protein n=1 Tax=Rhodocytophaga rosea TaxID=2704465 RepID=A0A6C0GH99_9BACT|nr:hypothetical protein [Rhodocytophaga rosea]QHT67319.1 hypothetical protein GXP67_12080 [Rhodocytophaga rosea]
MKHGQLKENRPFFKRSVLKSNPDITYSILQPVKKPTCFIIGESSLLIESARRLIKTHYQIKGIISDDVAV